MWLLFHPLHFCAYHTQLWLITCVPCLQVTKAWGSSSPLASCWFAIILREIHVRRLAVLQVPSYPVCVCPSCTQFSLLLPASCWFLGRLTLLPCRWMQYVPLKCQLTSARLHSVISQKIELFIVATVKTWNATRHSLLLWNHPALESTTCRCLRDSLL
jgi:hypothetical protein